MSLGYALLHRNRIEIALDAGPRKQTYDDLADFAFGVMGAGDLGEALNEFAQSRNQWFSGLIEQQRTRFTGENGPFSFVQNLTDRIGSMEGIADLSDELLNMLGGTSGAGLREDLHQWVDTLCNAIPDLSGEAMNRFLMEQVNDITAILEQPRLSGRRDVTAHRAFRAAVTLRTYISDGLDQAPWADADFDVRSLLCQMLHQVVDGIDDSAISGFVEFIQSFQSEYGGLLSASFSFSASVSVTTGDGPQGMPNGTPGYLDEVKAVSHPNPGGMWGLDLATNILATFFLIWESVRTDNYKDRWFDGTLSVITILWHATHTLMRAKWPESINRARDDDSGGEIVKNWIFTDQGNFSINLLLRLFQSFHDGTASNWALSFAARALKYFSNVTLIRSIYYFTRSVWYFKDRAANRSEGSPDEVSLLRLLWAIWGPMSWIAAFFSFFLSWDDFSLEEGFTPRTIVLLVLGIVLGLVVGYIVLWQIADENPFTMSVSADWWTMTLVFVCWILAVIALIIILADLESGSRGLAIGLFVGFAVLVVYGMIGLPFLWGQDNTGEHFFLQSFVIFCSIFAAGALPFFLWWFFIDDGRDKHGLFDGKDAGNSPYRLPYREGENWLCGQGVHGIFSHIPSDVSTDDDIDNEYAYDFNEKENKNALAARDGIVLDVVKDNQNGSDNANFLDIMHTSWHAGHDPGSDDERVLTYTTYFHLSRDHVWVDAGHRFVQGVHIADIDSTGRSAQHHLHFHAEEYQRRVPTNTTPTAGAGRRNMTLPVVFRDSSTHGFRNFPLLAWVPGKGHIEGKPLSMAFYTSDNQVQDPLVNPLVISLDEQGTPTHEHWILIDKTLIENGPLPASLTVRTTVNEWHFHDITLTQQQLADILRLRELSNVSVSEVNGHQHALVGYKYQQAIINVLLSDNGNPEHGHWLSIDQRTSGWEWGAIPAVNQTLTTDSRLTGTAAHTHDVEFTHQQLFDLLRRRRLPNLNSTPVNGHDHRLASVRGGPGEPNMDIVEPPRAQLLAENPGPYNLVGDQMVVRVNERATEYFFYGAHRPRLLGEIALDRGLGNAHSIDIDGSSHTPATTDTTVHGSLESLNTALAALPVQARVEPVIVVETLQRGSGASIVIGGGSSPAMATPGEGRGSGAFVHIDQATQAQLASHFNTYLTTGWPAAPAAIHARVDGSSRLELQLGGAAIVLPDKKTRNSDVLSRLYDSANTRLRATGDLPLSCGRIDITNSYGVPVLGTAAQVDIDTTHAAFSGADLTATTLEITVRGRTTEITLVSGDNAAAVLARKIALNAEGVRAWESSSNHVKVQTIAVGNGIQLEVRKRLTAGDFHQQNSGDAPALAISTAGCNFNGAIGDSNALAPNHCCAIIHDAVARATLPYDSGVVIDLIQMDGNQLVIRVNSGHTISATASNFSGATDPFGFSQNGPEEIRSTNLASNVDLNGPGWVELDVDGNAVTIPFDAEPARVDLAFGDRLPASGESLILNINGAGNSTLAFSGNEGSVDAIASAISQHFNNVSVRLAYRVSFENALYGQPGHSLQLNDASGLAMAGFLDDRTTYTTSVVSAAVTDQMLIPSTLNLPQHDDGAPVQAFTQSETTSGSDMSWQISVQAGFSVNVTTIPAADPLSISGGGTGTLSTGLIPAELELESQCQRYDFEILDSSSNVVTRSRLQIAATPAMLRSEDNFSATLPDNTVLPITVVEPDTGTTVDRVFSVDMNGIGSLAEVVYRLNVQVPAIRAWTATPGGNQRLHIESRGYGHGWKLRLGNPMLLLALGFSEAQIDLNAQQLESDGRGDVRNGAKMSHDEIRSALQRIDQCATQALFATGTPTGTPRSLQIERSGTSDLVLRSVEGPVTIETEPASLRTALNITESGGIATIAPGAANVALDCGIINVKAAGRSVAVVRLFADHATIVAAEPLATAGSPAETQQLTYLKAHAIDITTGSGAATPVGPLPAAIANLNDAVAWYAGHLPVDAWIGIDTSNHVVLQSRRRGNASLILEIDFSNFTSETFAPGDTLLGFVVAPSSGGNVWRFSGRGFGNVLDMNAVPAWSTTSASIEAYLSTAAQQGASRQAIYDVEVDTSAGPTDLRIRSQVGTRALNHPAPPVTNPVPGGIQFSVAGGGLTGTLLEANFSLSPPVRPGELSLEVTEAGTTRSVVALIAGAPARLTPLIYPTNVSVLNGKGLDIVLTGTTGTVTHNVQFTSVSSQQQVAAEVERQCQWSVRANIHSGAMIIETTGMGTVFRLTLNAPSVTPVAVTNNSATGFIAGSVASPVSLPLNGRGGGTVPDMNNIDANHYRDALLDGFINEVTVTDSATRADRQLDWGTYIIRRDTPPDYFTLASQRSGCMSSLEPIVYEMQGVVLNRDMERAPAIHSSVILSLPEVATLESDTFNLAAAATLSIELNNNGNIEDLPARSVVEVSFSAGDYTARDVARRIHEELFNRGAGRAAAYADGQVVVETVVPGLAGSVTVPTPGTATTGADQALLQKLTGGTGAVTSRGWPGTGFGNPGDVLRHGYRSKDVASAQADAQWIFSDGTATATVNVTSGQSLQDIQRAVDSALAAPTGGTGRIGLCLLGVDNTLYIEAAGNTLTLQVVVNGNTLATIDPGKHEPGGTPERAEEPAVGLRWTHEIRTFLLARDYVGDGDGSEVDDLGWIRTPAFANSLPAAFDNQKGSPAWNLSLPLGRYLMAVRADAAKTRNYHESGDMVISGNTHPADSQRHFLHQVRYWMRFDNAAPLGIGKLAQGTTTYYVADILW